MTEERHEEFVGGSMLRYYLVWATRRRRPFLEGAILERAAALIIEAGLSLGAHVTRVSSGGDHVVVTVEAPPFVSPSQIVGRLKRHSASHLRREFPQLRSLPSIWTRQYLATTEDLASWELIDAFVRSQPRHERARISGAAPLAATGLHGAHSVIVEGPDELLARRARSEGTAEQRPAPAAG